MNRLQQIEEELKQGNQRFLSNALVSKEWPKEIEKTKTGQKPDVVILSCIDSRVPVETIFDQGMGKILNIKIAGNCLTEETLASIEFSVQSLGAPYVLVLGHTKCGAIQAFLEGGHKGRVLSLFSWIDPTIEETKVDPFVLEHVKKTLLSMRDRSSALKQLEENQKN